jgi:hypothetical protein
MKKSAFLLSFLAFSALLRAQCPEITLGQLQVVQKAGDKGGKVTDLGFDLAAGNAQTRRYNKCWMTSANGKAYFEQIILHRLDSDNITFLTLNEAHFQRLQQSLEERHSNTGSIVYGKMFRYELIEQKMDGLVYYGMIISLRSQN